MHITVVLSGLSAALDAKKSERGKASLWEACDFECISQLRVICAYREIQLCLKKTETDQGDKGKLPRAGDHPRASQRHDRNWQDGPRRERREEGAW